MSDEAPVYLAKAEESLAGAESEFASGRYNNCANRAYYACFQAAAAALNRAGVRPSANRGKWSHASIQAQFQEHLLNRRKSYPARLRGMLNRSIVTRERGDYEPVLVDRAEAFRALERARTFVAAVRAGEKGAS